jgi:hypothetical protein
MNFVCVAHFDREAIDRLSAAEKEALDSAYRDYHDWLEREGHLAAWSPLDEPETATVIRSRAGKVSMTDGPYVETKEHLGGFFVIRAADREEAVAIAARFPALAHGAVEVRAMPEANQTDRS